ncbi:MAG: T9SS type A sorting domain-containing protein [Ignavibacteriae bacterium]|nr:T9SS type A sorting domain-containing protein [Ignavibacteriota bacterium]
MKKEMKVRLIYPNPMKPSGFEIELPEDAEVTIECFDENGNQHQTVCDKKPMRAGKQIVEFSRFGLSEGEYTFRIQAQWAEHEYRITKKVVVN